MSKSSDIADPIVTTNAISLKSAFETLFGALKIHNSMEASIYYVLLIAFKKPSMEKILSTAKELYGKEDLTRNDLQNGRENLLKHGIIAELYTSANDDDFDLGLEQFFPIDPSLLWTEHFSEIKPAQQEEQKHKGDLIKKFSELYHKKFSMNSPLLSNNQITLTFSERWPIYFLLSHAKPKFDLHLLLSGLKTFNKPLGDYYTVLLNRGVKINALFDVQDKDQVNRAKQLLKQFPAGMTIKYTKNQLDGTSRRIILDNIFAIDGMKIHPKPDPDDNKKTNKKQRQEKEKNSMYIGIFYFNKNKITIKENFDKWWKDGKDINNMSPAK